jgi:glutathione S-transferase
MAKKYELELISFKLCPFVQRSVITLKHKKVPYKITYIDLKSPPEWFTKISPLGQVPVLKVTDPETKQVTPIFESAVINEFLDETTEGNPFLSRDPLKRAFQRAWLAYGGELQGTMYGASMDTELESAKSQLDELYVDLARLDSVVEGPYFSGRDFSLVDSTYAPFFMRLWMIPGAEARVQSTAPRVAAWAKTLLALPEVRESVEPSFQADYRAYLKNYGAALFA